MSYIAKKHKYLPFVIYTFYLQNSVNEALRLKENVIQKQLVDKMEQQMVEKKEPEPDVFADVDTDKLNWQYFDEVQFFKFI